MSDDELTLLAIKGFISELPKEDKQKADKCISEIREVVSKYEEGIYALAIALLGAELQLKT